MSDDPKLPEPVKKGIEQLNDAVRDKIAALLAEEYKKEPDDLGYGSPLAKEWYADKDKVREFVKKHLDEVIKGLGTPGVVGRVKEADPATEAAQRLDGTFDPNTVNIELTLPAPADYIKIDFELSSDGKFKLTE